MTTVQVLNQKNRSKNGKEEEWVYMKVISRVQGKKCEIEIYKIVAKFWRKIKPTGDFYSWVPSP